MAGSLQGRTCVVTGASSGIGYETALGLARLGASVAIVGRDAVRTEAAAKSIRDATGRPVETFLADLSVQAEIRRLAETIRERFDSLDVLVNNAGAIFDEGRRTPDGIERTWALDHLAYVLLTLHLLDPLKAGAPSRIVNVSSAGHNHGRIDLDDLDGSRSYGAMRNYCAAKLGNVLFTKALARRLDGTGITVNAVHPGVIASGFGRGSKGGLGLIWKILRPLAKTPDQGARTTLHVASDPELRGVTGRYFSKCRETASSPASNDVALQEQVWALSLKQLGMDDPTSEMAERPARV